MAFFQNNSGDNLEKNGMIRKIDNLGRIVIPKEIRRSLQFRSGNDLEMHIEDDELILKKTDNLITDAFVRKIIRIFSINMHVDILLTSCDKIKYANMYTKRPLETMSLDNNTVKIIENREEKIVQNSFLIKEEHALLVIPLIINGDIKGSIILINNNLESSFDKNIYILVDILKIYLE